VYIIGPWYYRVRVEETRKELSYLSAMGAVTREGNISNEYTIYLKSEVRS